MNNVYSYISKVNCVCWSDGSWIWLLISKFEDLASGLHVLLGTWTVHVTEKSICYPDVVRMLGELLRGWKNRYRILIWFSPTLVMDSSFIFLATWYWLHVSNPKSSRWVIDRGRRINCGVNNFKGDVAHLTPNSLFCGKVGLKASQWSWGETPFPSSTKWALCDQMFI